MGILDEAIREHLDLKRKHGAREVEVQELEHDAFGPALQTGELPASPQAAEASELTEAARPAELDESPPEFETAGEAEYEPADQAVEQQVEAPVEEISPQPPTQEFVVPDLPEPPPPGTEERVLPFSQPEPGTEGAPPPESYEPPTEATIEEPIDKIGESLSVITEGESPTADFYEFDEEEVGEEEPRQHFEPAPVEGELAGVQPEYEEEEEEAGEEEGDYEESELEEGEYEETAPAEGEPALFDIENSDADVLEETPEFLRERPDDDELWFEQRPPKDFDL